MHLLAMYLPPLTLLNISDLQMSSISLDSGKHQEAEGSFSVAYKVCGGKRKGSGEGGAGSVSVTPVQFQNYGSNFLHYQQSVDICLYLY
ncbi:hypothetical protein E2C01_059172 [Portunus trituberculatus]|uniref:Uncharacterized protein n=1 Tax=Portunus trituberculatus TaxID=210409 RepID=A0A5B7H7L9_PORTR|nr:hypothetical protein [Portunus trituberculatus]